MKQDRKEYSLFNICGNRRHDWKNPEKNETLPLVGTIRAFLKIVFSYWKTHDSILAWVQFILILLFTATTVVLSKMFNDWYKEFWDNV